MRIIYFLLLSFCLQSLVNAQTSQISGNIYDVLTNEPLAFAVVNVSGTASSTATADENGKFVIEKLPAGLYNVDVRYVGYKNKTFFEVEVTLAKQAILEIGLEVEDKLLDEVEVKGPTFTKSEESPLSLRSIGVNEIERSPGGGRDISKVVQSLPGVASTPSFRNDIIVRIKIINTNQYLNESQSQTLNFFLHDLSR